MSTLARQLDTTPLLKPILDKYRSGHTPTAIANWLQEDMLMFSGVSQVALASELKRLIHEHVPLLERNGIKHQQSSIRETIAKFRSSASTLEELENLLALQLGRIEIDHEKENKIGKLFGSLNNEIELARRIANDIARIKQELGVDPRKPLEVDVHHSGSIEHRPMQNKLSLIAKRLVDKTEPEPLEIPETEIVDVDDD